MTEISNSDRREFFRIDDEVALSYEELSGEALKNAIRRYQEGLSDDHLLAAELNVHLPSAEQLLQSVRASQPELADFLEQLNDNVQKLMRRAAAGESGLSKTPTHQVELSAGGIRIDVDEKFAVGAVLDIKLLVYPAMTYIRAFATVANARENPRGSDLPGYRIGLSFSTISESYREVLAQHVTQTQLVRLRRQRQGADASTSMAANE